MPKMDDLREGRLDATLYYYEVDLPFYEEFLQGFLPEKVIDFHVFYNNAARLIAAAGGSV